MNRIVLNNIFTTLNSNGMCKFVGIHSYGRTLVFIVIIEYEGINEDCDFPFVPDSSTTNRLVALNFYSNLGN